MPTIGRTLRPHRADDRHWGVADLVRLRHVSPGCLLRSCYADSRPHKEAEPDLGSCSLLQSRVSLGFPRALYECAYDAEHSEPIYTQTQLARLLREWPQQ
jgi:hypothetical protein